MKVFTETSIRFFDGWQGAKYMVERIRENHLEDEFDSLIEDCYPEGIDETTLNDILWFEEDWLCEVLGLEKE